jgi:putative RecB family exonuclease
MPDHISASQMNLYLLCSLKYRFQYIDQLERPFRSSALVFGSAIHAALAWLHKLLAEKKGNGVTVDRLCNIFDADWYAQQLGTKILYDRNQSKEGFHVLARELLRIYLERPERQAKAAEVPFTVPLANPANGQQLDVNLEGFFDLITQDEAIVEFKTSGQTMSTRDADDHLQLTTYSYAYGALFGRPASGLRIVDLVKSRKPKMVVLDTMRTGADHQRFFCLAREVVNGIRSHVFIPRSGYWCRDCEYARHCKAWKGN